MSAPTFTILIPVYNEQDSLAELVAAIHAAMQPIGGDHEILFVDDGSTDGTLERIKRLAETFPNIRVFSFRKNLGKSQALTCGFQEAAGQYVLTLDADLQDDPASIQAMFEHLTRDGVDIVSGWRKERRDSLFKVVSSKIFNLIVIRTLFGASFKDMNSGLKLYRAEVTKDLRLYGGMHRFIPLIARELGYRVAEIPVPHHQRKYGTSKYRATKIVTEVPDLLTLFFLMKYTRRPLHFFARIGTALLTVGGLVLIYLTVLWFNGFGIGTRPLLTFGVLLVLIGGQTVFTGLLADLIVNVSRGGTEVFPMKYVSDRRASLDHEPSARR